MLNTISLRGMSAEHTAILIDGIRVNSAQNGLVDLGILSSSNIERIEILKGGSSALYGTDAVGGVVNIITRNSTEKYSGNVSTTFGSFGHNEYEQNAYIRQSDNLQYRFNIRRVTGEGNYKFSFDDGSRNHLLQRANADYSFLYVNGKMYWQPENNFSSFLDVNIEKAKRGSPNPVFSAFDDGIARLNDNNVRTNFGIEWKHNVRFTSTLRTSFQYGYETFTDPTWFLNDFYLNRSAIIEPSTRFIISENISGVVGGEFSRSWIHSNELKDVTRNQQSIFLSSEITATTFSNVSLETIFYPSIRYDNISDVGNAVSPKLGLNIGLLEHPELRLRSSFGKSFHAPTFNDLYYNYFGNPDLEPERSTSFDAGITAVFNIFGRIQLEANYFSIDTRERIVWVQLSTYSGMLKNFGRVKSEGVEIDGTWKLFTEKLSLSFNSTINTVKKLNKDFANDPTYGKQLRYLPKQTTNLSARYTLENSTISIQHSIAQERYTNEHNNKQLPDYQTTAASLLHRFSLNNVHPFIKLEMTNIFNESYQIIQFYPLPLKEYRVTLGLEMK